MSLGSSLFSAERNQPLEQVSLQTDRDLYLVGETIWFTASCFLENRGGPSPISQILYVELYNAEHKTFVQEKFKLKDGLVSGILHIPEELPTAYYFIRAYTMYLRNFPAENYFTTALTIVNPEYPIKQETFHDDIELFLQHGQLVSGVPNQLAIRFPASKAMNVQSFFIGDTSGTKISPVKFYQNGLAFCTFIPNDTALYKLSMVLKNSDTIEKLLPQPTNNGFVVQTTVTGQALTYKLLGNQPENGFFDSYTITIRSQEFVVLYNDNTSFENLKKGMSIPENQLSPGLNYIELRSPGNTLIDLQTVFIEAPEINISIIASKQTYLPREKVEMEIETKGLDNSEIEFLQLSVIKKGTISTISENLPAILISNPQLLRDKKNISFDKAIKDQINVALQIYSDRLEDKYGEVVSTTLSSFDYIPEIRDISITGLVEDKKTKEPVAGVRVYASVMHEEFQLHSTQTSADGRFAFSLPNLQGKYDVFICPEFDTLHKVNILLKNDFSSQITDLFDRPPDIDTSARKLLEEMLLNQQVSLNFNHPGEVFPHPSAKLPAWFGDGLITIQLKDYIALSTIQEVFNEIVPFVRLKEKNEQFKLHVYDDQSEVYYEDPLVLLDGIPITDVNILLQLYPAQLDRIEVLNRTFILGNLTIRGLVSVRTKTDNFGGVQLPDDVVFVNYQTRTSPAEFIPVNVESDNTIQRPMPLFRNLLYFHSFGSLSEIPEKISFYTSDHVSEYEIIVKGKTVDGHWITGRNEIGVIGK